MDRLLPFEALEGDYYLDNRDVWNSDDERGNYSSDEEMRDQIEKLAGVKSSCKPKAKKILKDEFESDMDESLDEQFVNFASSKIFAQNKGFLSRSIEDHKVSISESQVVSSVSDFDMGKNEEVKIVGRSSILKTSDASSKRSTGAKKSVTIADQPSVYEVADQRFDIDDVSDGSAFSDKSNVLRKAADKAVKDSEPDETEFYNSDEDDDNERWVQQHRAKLKNCPTNINYDKKYGEADELDEESHKLENTDAVLSCPACMSVLTRDCQRHEFYRNQYRAMFVENCKILEDQFLFLPQPGAKTKMNKRKESQSKRNDFMDKSRIGNLPKEDLFLRVNCSICDTNVGVYDFNEIYHFFNVLAGYA